MRRVVLAVFVFLAAVFMVEADANALLKVEGRYWFTDLSDTLKVSKSNVIGTELKLGNDLGIDEKRNFWEGRVTLELGSSKIRYGFMPLKWKGSRTLSRSIVFNGKTYSASTTVDTKLDINYHRLSYEYDFIDTLSNRLGVIFEVKYFDTKASLNDSALGIKESRAFNIPLPTLGIAAQVGLPFLFNVGGEVTGIAIGKSAYLVDGEAALNFKPIPFFTASAGYRVFKIHADKNDNKADITLKGPFASLRADF